jgi:hypothetical protein
MLSSRRGFGLRISRHADPANTRPMNTATAAAFVGLATIEGALVALPSPAALERLAPLRSPAWALVAPGSLLFGTFGVLALPSLATGLAILAVIATPLLAAIAVASVVHGRSRSLLLLPLALGVGAVACTGLASELAATLLTALGCLTLGVAIVRLTPIRSLQLGLLAMALVDVLLLALGLGQPAAALLSHALNGSQPAFHHAELGPATIDYPDLVLAAILGGIVAGRATQPQAALLVAALASAYSGLLVVADMIPATVPLVLAMGLVEFWPPWRPIARQLKGIEGPHHGSYGRLPWRTTGGQAGLGPPPPTPT